MPEENGDSCVNVQDLQAGLTRKVNTARLGVFAAVAEVERVVDVAFNLEAQAGLLRVSAVHATTELQDLAGLLQTAETRAKEAFNSKAFLGAS